MANRKAALEDARRAREEQEQAAAAQARRRRATQLMVGGVFVAALVIAAIIAISQSGGGSSGGSAADVSGGPAVDQELQGIPQKGTVLGDPSAKVTVVEYGDPQCPICGEFATKTVPTFIDGPVRDGKARYEFKPWLIIGPDSKPAAEAALAAGEQDRFFQYIELFYRNQGEENSGYVTDDFLMAIAKAAGVPDLDQWDADRKSGKYDSELQAVNSEATRLGFSGTPTVVVIGPGGKHALAGVPTEAELEKAIKQAS